MISIVVTAYNVGKYIEECVLSVLAQTYKDIECIVVCDAPTDNTIDVVESIKDDRIRVIKNAKNVGAGLSRRYGIEAADGEYVLLLDGDDYLHEDFIESLYNNAVETGADIVSGGIEVLRENGVRDITLYGNTVTYGNDKVAKFWGERIVFMNNKLIRRTLHGKVPYCHRRYIEDTPVIIPMLWYANKVSYIDNAGYVYRMQPSSLTHTTTPIKDIIYKGLCWCDLYEFFTLHDNTLFDALDVKGYIGNIVKMLNGMQITAEDVEPYKDDWVEFSTRLCSTLSIQGISIKDKQPVGVICNGRFANQMFAVGHALAKYGVDTPLVVDKPTKELQYVLNANGVKFTDKGNVTLCEQGYFQDRYVQDVGVLRQSFAVSDELRDAILGKYPDIGNSVVCHVRRGDYLTDGNEKVYNVLTPEYIERVYKKHFDGKRLIIVTDDVEWCRKYISIDADISGENALVDFYIMVMAGGIIASASTYSIMACYLNPCKSVVPYPLYKDGQLADIDGKIVPEYCLRENLIE